MKSLHVNLLCLVLAAVLSACSSGLPRPSVAARVHRTQLDDWMVRDVAAMGLRFECPRGDNTLVSPDSVLIELHGVTVPSIPSDTQYLITISIKTFSKEYWTSAQEREEKTNKELEKTIGNNPNARLWLEFNKWFYYSMSPEVSMRENAGSRYYRRVFDNKRGKVVKISAEFVPRMDDSIAKDDAAIRRIMSSVQCIKVEESTSGVNK